MNFLFVLVKEADDESRKKLNTLSPRGMMGVVWQLFNEQAARGDFDKKEILSKTGISSSHLDKITSELLARCYHALFEDDSLALLNFLSSRVVFIKLFYHELAQHIKAPAHIGDKEHQADFIKQCFRMIHSNMPIVYREEVASKKLAELYISLFKGAQKKEAEFYMGCKLIFEKIQMLFAAIDFKDKADFFEKEFKKLGTPQADFNEEVVFDYYWTRIYFYHALEDFTPALAAAETALSVIPAYKSKDNKLNILRIESKINEFLYYLSRFDEAFDRYQKLINSEAINTLPDRTYHTTKYIQLGMITGHMDEAGRLLKDKMDQMGDKVDQLIIARDIVTYVKYCLFNGDYETAFRFIQLGFEKNPKGKYFQYEIEFRNLQTAYFFLSGQEDVALDMCQKHIKFLRNNGYTTSNSDYPYFYVLIKAIFDRKTKRGLSPRHQKMFDLYQQGSFAIYGRLLMKIAKQSL